MTPYITLRRRVIAWLLMAAKGGRKKAWREVLAEMRDEAARQDG